MTNFDIWHWLIVILIAAFLLVVYLLPFQIARWRRHANTVPILIMNLVFGWTLAGWVVCLVWSFTGERRPATIGGVGADGRERNLSKRPEVLKYLDHIAAMVKAMPLAGTQRIAVGAAFVLGIVASLVIAEGSWLWSGIGYDQARAQCKAQQMREKIHSGGWVPTCLEAKGWTYRKPQPEPKPELRVPTLPKGYVLDEAPQTRTDDRGACCSKDTLQ